MKYELIKKEVLDQALELIMAARASAQRFANLSKAYKLLQENRTQCNVMPEGEYEEKKEVTA